MMNAANAVLISEHMLYDFNVGCFLSSCVCIVSLKLKTTVQHCTLDVAVVHPLSCHIISCMISL